MRVMKGQDSPGIGIMYLVFFILLLGVGGYWILHSNTWVDFNVLYGPPSSFSGKVTRIDSCENPKKTLVMLDTGKSQAYVYMGFAFEVVEGDYLTLTAYNVTGRGLFFDILRSQCEPVGFHYYASKAYSSRTGFQFDSKSPN
jgi:hypothetical protein